VKVLREREEFPEKESFQILFGKREKPLLSWRGEGKAFFQKESPGGAGMQKPGTG
jgi:hypothetical protein